MSKHDLRARPVFHHTRDAIEAHLTVVMAALAIARHLQDTTGISIKRIIHALKPLQEITINLNGHHLTAADPLTPEAEEILTALRMEKAAAQAATAAKTRLLDRMGNAKKALMGETTIATRAATSRGGVMLRPNLKAKL